MTWWMWLLAVNGYIGMIFATYIVLKKTGYCGDDEPAGTYAFFWPVFLLVFLPIDVFIRAFELIDNTLEKKAEQEETTDPHEEIQDAEIRDLREEVMKLKAKSLVALDYKKKLEKSYGIKPLDEHSWATYAQHACQELDKVSVVRCKDCAYYKRSQVHLDGPVYYCGLPCGETLIVSHVGENDFCSRGRRK